MTTNMVKLSIRLKLLLMLTVALISIGAINLFHLHSQNYLTIVLKNSMLKSIQIMRDIQLLQDNGLSVISFHRAYLINGDDKELRKFEDKSNRYLESIHKLKKEFASQAENRILVEKLEHLYRDWLTTHAIQQIKARKRIHKVEETLESISRRVEKKEGKMIIDKLRVEAGVLNKQLKNEGNLKAQLLLAMVMLNVVDAETGERGYLLTGDDSFLEPYYSGIHKFDSNINALYQKTSGNKKAQSVVNNIKKLFYQWRYSVASNEIKARLKYNKYPVSIKKLASLLESSKSNKFISEINHISNLLESNTLQYVNDTIKSTNNEINKTKWLSIIFVILTMATLLLLFLILIRGISRSLQVLTEGARKIGLGELSHKILIDSNTELIALSEEFNQMGRSLKKQHVKLKKISETDGLTGVLNRKTFELIVNKHVAGERREGEEFSFFFLDVDNFKTINDTYGHFVGDEILEALSRRLTLIIRETDYLARMGGDEFAILLTPIKTLEESGVVAERIMQLCESKFEIDGVKHTINLSIGISTYPSDGKDFATLQKNADLALYKAKQSGRNQYQFFTKNIAAAFEKRKLIVDLLDEPFGENFTLFFQPVFSILEGKPSICGAEVLLRVKRNTGANIEEVISIAEETNNIVHLGNEIIDRVFANTKIVGSNKVPLKFAINLSVKQIQDPDFISQLKYIMETHKVATQYITFELTETVLMEDHFELTSILQELRQMGYNLALDDYGKGYSSLARLRDLPINIIKLDMSFINKLVEEPETQIIVRSTVELSNELGLNVVAEGVENEEQLQLLKEYKCHMVQGYLLGKPMPWEEFLKLIN